MAKRPKRKKQSSFIVSLLIIGVIVLVAAFFVHLTSQNRVLGDSTNNLQINFFIPTTPTPTIVAPTVPVPSSSTPEPNPTSIPVKTVCASHSQVTEKCDCSDGEQTRVNCTDPAKSCVIMAKWYRNVGTNQGYEAKFKECEKTYADLKANNCEAFCIMKPVVYLYPQTTQLVDVAVDTPGDIYISDPHYPTGGWKNVLAHPNGELVYEGKKYKELFYESEMDTVKPPTNGIVIASKDLERELRIITYKLGLQGAEQQEFLDFWVAKLGELQSPYILFSLVETSEKERIDRLVITPKPDTMIDFLAYFKPLDHPIEVTPLVLPENPPKRNGFTVVEWGGTIDNKKLN